jgi:DNA-binding transcriptional MerR regulator
MDKEYYTTKELSEKLSITISTLEYWRSVRRSQKRELGPPFVRIEGSVRYKISDVDNWLKKMQS